MHLFYSIIIILLLLLDVIFFSIIDHENDVECLEVILKLAQHFSHIGREPLQIAKFRVLQAVVVDLSSDLVGVVENLLFDVYD